MNQNDPKKLFSEGLKFYKSNEYEYAVRKFNQVLKLNPKNINTMVILSQIYRKKKDFKKYEFFLKKIIKEDKSNFQALNNLATHFKNIGLRSKAETYYKESLVYNKNYANAYFNLALLYEENGSLVYAEKLYLKALETGEYKPSIIYNLLRLNQDYLDKVDLKKIKNITNNQKFSLEERGYAYFILSISARKNKNIDQELELLNFGHEFIFKSDPIYHSLSEYWINTAPNKFSNSIKFKNVNSKLKDFEKINPIFVMGLPRSGTTLVETLLASNKERVINCGEISIIPRLIESLETDNLHTLKENILREYNKVLKTYKNNSQTFIDKTLENIFFVDIISKIFPKSKIIICEREYFHSFVAIFQQCLHGLPWTHKKSSIMKYIQNFDCLIKKLKKNKKQNILFVHLKDLTINPEENSRKILNFCNLDWGENVLKFYERKDLTITTASNIQIRKKIFKYNSEKFKPYEKHLKEYFDKINKL